jgi:hypothetical protein
MPGPITSTYALFRKPILNNLFSNLANESVNLLSPSPF